jgi:hypothetical protein
MLVAFLMSARLVGKTWVHTCDLVKLPESGERDHMAPSSARFLSQHPHHFSFLHNLPTVISTVFKLLGKMDDLEEAVSYFHQALDLSSDHSDRSSALASALRAHFDHLGEMNDLENVIM